MRYLLKKAAMKMMKRQLAAAFSRWKEMWEEMCHLRDIGNKVVRRMARQKLYGAWNKWIDFIDDIHKQREASEDAEAERLRIEERQKKVANRLLNSRLAGAFDGWRAAVQRKKDQRALVDKSLRRMKQVLLHSAFSRWAEMAEESREMRAKVARVLGKIMNREMAQAWEAWWGAVEESREHAERMEEIMAKAVLRMIQAKLAAAFTRWHEYAIERAEMRRKLNMAAMRMMKRQLSASWQKWIEFVEDSKEEKARMEELMAKAIGKFMNKFMGAAFERWKEMTMEHQEQRRILMVAIGKLRSRQKAAAFARWCEFIEEFHEAEERKRQTQERVIARFLRGALAKAWRTWYENWQELAHMRNIVKGALKRMSQRALSSSFNKWYEIIEEKREMEGKLRKAVIRMTNMCLASAFTKWEGMVRRKRDARLKAMGARQMQLGAGEFAAPIIEQIRQMAADGKALLENPKVEGQRKPSEAVVREVGYRIENLSRLQHALKSGFVEDPNYKPTDDPDDHGVREDIEPELTGAKDEILDELTRLHGAMSALSDERQALQSQMAAMLNHQRDEEKKMMYVFRHKLAEELRRGEADLQSRLGRLVNSMRSPNWFVDQRKKIEEERAKAAEERARREAEDESKLPPEVSSGDITASAEFRPKTAHGPAIVEAQEHTRPLPLSAEESLTGMSIRKPKDSLQEEFIDNTERMLEERGGADVTAEVLLSRTALQRKPVPPGGGPKPVKPPGRKLVPRVAMTAPSSQLWSSSGGKRGGGPAAAAWGSPSAADQQGVGAPSEWGFQVAAEKSAGTLTLPDISTPGGKTRQGGTIPYPASRQENRTPPAGIQGVGQGQGGGGRGQAGGGTPRQALIYGAHSTAAAPRHGRPAPRPATSQQPRNGSPGREGPRPAPPSGPPGAITTPRAVTAGMKTRPGLVEEHSGGVSGW